MLDLQQLCHIIHLKVYDEFRVDHEKYVFFSKVIESCYEYSE